MRRKLTITLDPEVYDGLHRVVGRRKIAPFIEKLLRPQILRPDLEANYREMAGREKDEREALDWIEGLAGDVPDEPW